MRKILSIIITAITPFIAMVVICLAIINFGIEPFSKFAKGNFKEQELVDIFSRTIVFYQIFIFPIISVITGLIAGVIARNREYLIGLISVIPFCAIWFEFSLNYGVQLLIIYVFVSLGVYIARRMKSPRKKT
jgi:hypothetical protein